MKPFYRNPAAKYHYMKMVKREVMLKILKAEADAWRAAFASGKLIPPPPGNPYITPDDHRRFFKEAVEELIKILKEWRDNGVSRSEAYNRLVKNGVDVSFAKKLIDEVYPRIY